MNKKKTPVSRPPSWRVNNLIERKPDQEFDPEAEGDDIYEQIEDIDPDELLSDYGLEDDEDDLY